jgi:hypothetical protein
VGKGNAVRSAGGQANPREVRLAEIRSYGASCAAVMINLGTPVRIAEVAQNHNFRNGGDERKP